jgi:RimJ/RimL family protein N-acetyltransferase
VPAAGGVRDTPSMPEPTASSPRVRLRDVTLADADMIDAWDARRSPFNDFGMPSEPIDRDALRRGPLRNERNGMLIVERLEDGRPLGTVGWHIERYGPNPESAAFNVGIELIPEVRGQGYGTEAQLQLVAYLFATTGVNRVEAATDLENVPEQRSLEKAGFRREGVLRGSQFRGGSYHDLVYYAVLRDEVEATSGDDGTSGA